MEKYTGVLLINLGTPDSPHPKDVKRYLHEFLTDGRVIDMPWLTRQLLVRGSIVPKRYKQTASSYEKIWTPQGSPLLLYGRQIQNELQRELGNSFRVELSMRYQNPSIQEGLDNLLRVGVSKIIVFPLFPQFSSATTGSVHQKVMEIVRHWQVIPTITFIDHFYKHPAFINAVSAVASKYKIEDYDHILFSFHGLPERQIKNADRFGCCLKTSDCCHNMNQKNRDCYTAQCYATAESVTSQMKIPKEKYSICFQSRLGKDPWLQPYTSDAIKGLANKGFRNLLVFSPSFVCDCLETTFELGIEYAHEFKQAGGDQLTLVEGLNAHPQWISALKQITIEH